MTWLYLSDKCVCVCVWDVCNLCSWYTQAPLVKLETTKCSRFSLPPSLLPIIWCHIYLELPCCSLFPLYRCLELKQKKQHLTPAHRIWGKTAGRVTLKEYSMFREEWLSWGHLAKDSSQRVRIRDTTRSYTMHDQEGKPHHWEIMCGPPSWWSLELICEEKWEQTVEVQRTCSVSSWNSWIHSVPLVCPLQTRMTNPPIALQSRTPPATPPTPGSRVGSAAWATGSGWHGTTWGPSSLSSSSVSWLWPLSTWCRLSSTGGPSKTLSSLSSSMSAGPGPLQTRRTLQHRPRRLFLSPSRPLSKSLLNCTETMRQCELFAKS